MREVLLISSFSQMRKQKHKEGKCFAEVTQRVSDGSAYSNQPMELYLNHHVHDSPSWLCFGIIWRAFFVLHLEQVKFLLLNYASIKLEKHKEYTTSWKIWPLLMKYCL